MILQSDIRTFYELQPVLPVGQWWQVGLLVAAVVILLLWSIWMYRRDSVDLNPASSFLLTVLRLLSIGALVLFVVNPGQRSETRIVKPSRLAILMDNSLSMGLMDPASQDTADRVVRYQPLVKWIKEPHVQQFRSDHQVSIYRFGDADQPELIQELPKLSDTGGSKFDLSSAEKSGLTASGTIAWGAVVIGCFAIFCAAFGLINYRKKRVSTLDQSNSRFGTWWFSLGVLLFFVALLNLAAGDLWAPRLSLAQALGVSSVQTKVPAFHPALQRATKGATQVSADGESSETEAIVWDAEITPQGTSTRLGSAIQYIVNKEQGGPIAGIVVFSDGQSNSGIPVDRAIASATNAGIPVFTVGIGNADRPQNVLVDSIESPERVLPGDKFQVKALIKSFGLEGRTARVQLVSVDEKETEAEVVEDETNVRMLGDGQAVRVEFATSRNLLGKRRYEIRVDPFKEDLDTRDNRLATVVEVIEQQTHVLLIAGGPTREFRFLRNQLHRDKDIHLHVWLQSADAGADQESDVLLQSFPNQRAEVYKYDCIIAIDPDWRLMDANQMKTLERWVAEQAGGLITIAGPVNTPQWTRQPRGDDSIDIVRKLYPVSFYSQGSSVLKLGRFGGATAFPLEFTRQGRSAEYLWIGDSAGESQETWAKFDGVFGYYAVNDAKSGAEILANFADPETSIDGQLPIYLSSQFYGAGRVFFQASGEMWRVRRLDVAYFQQYYTKLIRWASQGRLSRDSTRGVLLTDRERCWMGDTIRVQAILKDAQDQPLDYPQVEANLITPGALTQNLTLRSNPNAASPGSFTGNFVAGAEGEYRINLAIPENPNLDVLTATVVATIPDLEKEQPQRNEAVLSKIAKNTGGKYFESIKLFSNAPDHSEPAAQLISPQDQETIIAGTFDRFFKRKFMIWVLGLLTTSLATEWILRRLQKLA